MSKHTPGPWQTFPEECDKPYIRIRGTVPGARYKVANVLTPVYEGVHPREADETRANASLIAAAPDLLALAEKIAHGEFNPVSWVQEARDAIAKARGES